MLTMPTLASKRRGDHKIKCVIGDEACDTRSMHDAAENVRAKVVVPPAKNARINKDGSKSRNKAIKRTKKSWTTALEKGDQKSPPRKGGKHVLSIHGGGSRSKERLRNFWKPCATLRRNSAHDPR